VSEPVFNAALRAQCCSTPRDLLPTVPLPSAGEPFGVIRAPTPARTAALQAPRRTASLPIPRCACFPGDTPGADPLRRVCAPGPAACRLGCSLCSSVHGLLGQLTSCRLPACLPACLAVRAAAAAAARCSSRRCPGLVGNTWLSVPGARRYLATVCVSGLGIPSCVARAQAVYHGVQSAVCTPCFDSFQMTGGAG